MLSVTSSRRPPASTRPPTGPGCDELAPRDATSSCFPEAFARDFGEAGSDVSPYAEPLDGPFATELAAVAAERGTTVVAGMFETGEDPARPFNTLVAPRRRRGVVPQDPPLRLLRLPRVRPAHAGPLDAGGRRRRRVRGRADDLLRPALPRARPARWSTAGAEVLVVPAAWVAGPRKVDHWRTLVRARAIENTVFVVAAGPARPALHRALAGRGPARRRARRGRRRTPRC